MLKIFVRALASLQLAVLLLVLLAAVLACGPCWKPSGARVCPMVRLPQYVVYRNPGPLGRQPLGGHIGPIPLEKTPGGIRRDARRAARAARRLHPDLRGRDRGTGRAAGRQAGRTDRRERPQRRVDHATDVPRPGPNAADVSSRVRPTGRKARSWISATRTMWA